MSPTEEFKLTGFPGTVEDLRRLEVELETQAVASGLAAPLLLAQAVSAVRLLCTEYGEAGGLRVDFLKQMDRVALGYLSAVEGAPPATAAKLAFELRTKISGMVEAYSPLVNYA